MIQIPNFQASIDTITDEKASSRPVSGVFKETDVMMAETENLIKNSYDAAYKALGTTGKFVKITYLKFLIDDETGSDYEEIPSDLKALKLTTPRKSSVKESSKETQKIEKELGKIASDIDNVADNLQKSSSTENVLEM